MINSVRINKLSKNKFSISNFIEKSTLRGGKMFKSREKIPKKKVNKMGTKNGVITEILENTYQEPPRKRFKKINPISANLVLSDFKNLIDDSNYCIVISDDEKEDDEQIENDQKTKLRDMLTQKDAELNKLHSAHDDQDKILEGLLCKLIAVDNIINLHRISF